MKKLNGLTITLFLESPSRVDLGLWPWQPHRRVSTLDGSPPSAALRMCRLLVSQRSAILSATCCETVEAGQLRDGKGGPIMPKRKRNSLRYSLSCEPNPQHWLSKARKGAACASLPAYTLPPPPRISCPFLESKRGGKSTSRAKYFHSEESPRGCLLPFLSAGADHKQWRPVL